MKRLSIRELTRLGAIFVRTELSLVPNPLEGPRTQRQRIFIRFAFFVSPACILFAAINLASMQWVALAVDAAVFAILVAVHLLRAAEKPRAAINTLFWSSLVVYGVFAYVVPLLGFASADRTGALVLAVAAAAVSVVTIGLLADRSYQINITFVIALITIGLATVSSATRSTESVQAMVAAIALLCVSLAIAHFERRLSLAADAQLAATQSLNLQLEAIHDAESKALSHITEQFGNVCHDIRTPLTAVLNIPALLRETELTEEQQKYIDMLDRAHRLMFDVVRDGLDGNSSDHRPGAAATLDSTDVVNVSELIDDAVTPFRAIAESNNTELTTVVPEAIPLLNLAACDISRILANVVQNATKYTNDGAISIEAKWNDNGYHGGIGKLTLIVRDSGRGMDPIRLAEVRVGTNGADPSVEGSNGIGLRSCRSLLSSMHGSLHIESGIGVGTTVTICIPSRAQSAAKNEPNSQDARDDANRATPSGQTQLHPPSHRQPLTT